MLRTSALFATTLAAAAGPLASEAAAQSSAYTPTGIGMGGFRLFPILDLGVGYTSNVFADSVNEQSDIRYTINPSLRLASEWSTHALNFYFSAPAELHGDFESQNKVDLIGSVDGQLDVSRTFNLTANASYADAYETLADSPSTVITPTPIHYSHSKLGLGAEKTFNRVSLTAGFATETYDFEDERDFNGVLIEQDDRDHTMLGAAVRAGYSISPATSFFVEGRYHKFDYDLIPPAVFVNRDSDGYEALAGVAFEVSNLITGEVSAGYLTQSYDQPGVENSDGVAAHARVRWQPDALVGVTFEADREIQAGGAVASISNTVTQLDFGLDYAFRRNVEVGLGVKYRIDDYTGIDREDDRWGYDASVAYYFNRGFGLFTTVGHDKQSTSGVNFGREFDVTYAEVGIRLRR
ncbi:MAG: outer membrane beta-barrel protein [Hyphomonadaceae bacterium]|nr:outer membrane beta-barrel protein [Hyphomonadaceae bacterium]